MRRLKYKEVYSLDKYRIVGGASLKGEVTISGAKNAAVAIIPAAIMSDEVCRIENIPNISDVTNLLKILQIMGAEIKMINKSTIEIDPRGINTYTVPDKLSRCMRASSYFLGVLLSKFNKATVALPGGCYLGVRPIDQHIKGFESLGATVSIEDGGMVVASADKLTGASVYFDNVTVGATMNVMMAAVKAEGLTVIENAAKEPHIVDLANFLNSMGANIRGAGTDVIKVRGVESLHGTTYSIIPDQIEAGTYMVAAAATGGDVLVKNIIPKHLEPITAKIIEAGGMVDEFDDSVHVYRTGELKHTNIKTMPHPGFPTDMQPQFAVLLSTASGVSKVSEGIWEDRFRYVSQLLRMGADILVDGKSAIINGVKKLKGAPVNATDLRAGAALIIAGLIADGVTEIEDIYHIQRGYEDVVEKFRSLGADISYVSDEPSNYYKKAL